MEEITKSVGIYLIDENECKIKIGSARVFIEIQPPTWISSIKEKYIILEKINLDFNEGDVIYQNNLRWLDPKFRNNNINKIK